MAIGVNTYKGLGVPRYGESEMRQESSLDMLTMTHSTLDGGDFLVLRNNVPEGSTISGDGTDVLRISSAGALAGPRVKVVATTVSQVLTNADSGTLFNIGAAGTPAIFNLPQVPLPGVWFEFAIMSTQDAVGDVVIMASSVVAADIWYNGASSLVSTLDSLTPETTLNGEGYVKLTAISSLRWVANAQDGYSSASTLGKNQFTTASTA